MTVVVGFDFDLTLGDTRRGIADLIDRVAAQLGLDIDGAEYASRLGLPLERQLAEVAPPDKVAELMALYRADYTESVVPKTGPMPGAENAIDAVRRLGGRVLVVSAKPTPLTKLHIERLGFDVDEVIGDVFAEEKGAALAERSADIYVGDHVGDVVAAKVAGALSVTVPGGSRAEELREAGTDVVLDDLTRFPEWLDHYVLDRRLADLDARLKEVGSVLVAYSGGADSAFLLAAAVRALGPERVVAATAVSPSLPAAELEPARRFAAGLGVRHVTPTTNEMAREGYRANAGDRCYFCKAELLEVLGPLATELDLASVATGTNADDARAGFRPGIRAANERGAVTPLLDAGFTKEQVRAASRRWALETADKPAAACLSSRIAYGLTITPARLARVEHAEAALRAALDTAAIPVRDLRVRDLGDSARVEVNASLVDAVGGSEVAMDAVRSAGFTEVTVEPFRSGSMNELLGDPERYR